jgi:uncharacterized membrane protein YbhN (UPF0104 family)
MIEKTAFLNSWRSVFFRLLVPLVFFGLAFQVISPIDIVRVMKEADIRWFAVGCVCVLAANWLSSLRTRFLLPDNPPGLVLLWHIHALRALITGLLPFSAGELSYVYYLRKYCVTPAAKGMGLLVSIRFLEFALFLCLLFLLASIGLFIDPSKLNQVGFVITGTGIAGVVVLAWKPAFFLKHMTEALGFLSIRLVKKKSADHFMTRVDQFSLSVKQVFASRKRGWIGLQTLGVVVIRNGFVLSMLAAMGVTLTGTLIVFLFIFLFVTRFFQGFGSFGNQEAGITGALILLGYPGEKALAIAVGTHLLQWFPVLILGGISYFGIHGSKASPSAD